MRAAENGYNPGGGMFLRKKRNAGEAVLKRSGGNAPESKAEVSERHIFLTTESVRAESAVSAQASGEG